MELHLHLYRVQKLLQSGREVRVLQKLEFFDDDRVGLLARIDPDCF